MDPLGIIISFPRPRATAARASIRRSIVARCASTCNWTEGGHFCHRRRGLLAHQKRRILSMLWVKQGHVYHPPSHHHKYISGIKMYKPFPVMGGKHDIVVRFPKFHHFQFHSQAHRQGSHGEYQSSPGFTVVGLSENGTEKTPPLQLFTIHQ